MTVAVVAAKCVVCSVEYAYLMATATRTSKKKHR